MHDLIAPGEGVGLRPVNGIRSVAYPIAIRLRRSRREATSMR
jgi:hypothetical protein